MTLYKWSILVQYPCCAAQTKVHPPHPLEGLCKLCINDHMAQLQLLFLKQSFDLIFRIGSVLPLLHVARAGIVFISAFTSVFSSQRCSVDHLCGGGGLALSGLHRVLEICYFVLGGSISCIAQFYAVNMLQKVLPVNKSRFKCSRKAHFYTKETDTDVFTIYINNPPCLGNLRKLRLLYCHWLKHSLRCQTTSRELVTHHV